MSAPPSRSFKRADGAVLYQCAALAIGLLLGIGLWNAYQGAAKPLSGTALVSIVSLGALGIWRYSWGLVHWLRAGWYIAVYFPRVRRRANRFAKKSAPPLYCIVPSYEMPPAIFRACFTALLREAARYPGPLTIVAAVGTPAEQNALEALYHEHGTLQSVHLWLQLQDGSGKRAALAEGLRATARALPEQDALVLLMDGDTILSVGSLLKTARLFQACPWLGAASTDNRAAVAGSPLLGEWYDLRLAQRHILMASLALSHRLLVLTGRFSMLRAAYAVQPSFVAQIENDTLGHWRYGDIPLLTGDDKSTWHWLLRRNVPMLYVPDVTVWSLETPCTSSFAGHTTALMRRWFGNMLRGSDRALRLGPLRMPGFVWWCLLDQRLSMWTALAAPTAVGLLAALHGRPEALYAYGLWVLFSRFSYGLLLGLSRGRISGVWPFLLYYNQVVGALIKIHALFHLAPQAWNRQRVRALVSSGGQRLIGHGFEVTALLTFVYWVALMVGVADAPHF